MTAVTIDNTMVVESIRRAAVEVDFDELMPTTTLRELRLDSMDMMSIFLEIEEGCGIQVPDEIIMQLNSIESIVDYLKSVSH